MIFIFIFDRNQIYSNYTLFYSVLLLYEKKCEEEDSYFKKSLKGGGFHKQEGHEGLERSPESLIQKLRDASKKNSNKGKMVIAGIFQHTETTNGKANILVIKAELCTLHNALPSNVYINV